jgi:hypothetical protein
MARPTFQIDARRLRGMREEQALTQQELSLAVARHAGTADRRTPETLKSDYQRIERTGRTSRKTATAIAAVLKTTVEQLQAGALPEAIDYHGRLKRKLQVQLLVADNTALQRALDRAGADDVETGLGYLASDIGAMIEAAQLSRHPDLIEKLQALTGMPEADLLAPANVEGHWFVTVQSNVAHRSDVLHGVHAVGFHIKTTLLGDRIALHGSDVSIRLWRDGMWYRMVLALPNGRDVMRVDFVRCQPDGKGLRWLDSSWRDDWFIRDDLLDWAWGSANFVTDSSGRTAPAALRDLRLVVTEHSGYAAPLRRMVITSDFDELPEQTKAAFVEEGDSHHFAVSRLVFQLWRALGPYLLAAPAECWRLNSSGALDIHFDDPVRGLANRSGLRYRIQLVEVMASQELVRAPWRQRDMQSQQERIQGWLAEGFTICPDDEPVPEFSLV